MVYRSRGDIKCRYRISVPTNLPVLCRIEAHLSNIITEQGITHQASMICIRLTIETSWMSKTKIMSKFMHLNSWICIVLSDIHWHPTIDVSICGIPANITITIAIFNDVHNLIKLTRQIESKLLLNFGSDGIVNFDSIISSKGDWDSYFDNTRGYYVDIIIICWNRELIEGACLHLRCKVD